MFDLGHVHQLVVAGDVGERPEILWYPKTSDILVRQDAVRFSHDKPPFAHNPVFDGHYLA
jgi:hypothetical protein